MYSAYSIQYTYASLCGPKYGTYLIWCIILEILVDFYFLFFRCNFIHQEKEGTEEEQKPPVCGFK